MNPVPQSVSNFLVPASGSTNSVVFDQTFVAGTPVVVNFAGYQISGIPFRPSGVLIDNTASPNPISVEILEIGYTMQCAAGEMLHLPYPAPINHTASISGDGVATVIFVDYPVIPYSSRFVASIAQPVQVTVTGPNPLPVQMTGALGAVNAVNYSIADDGVNIPVDSLAQTLVHNGDGSLNYVQVAFDGNNYRQTFTYTAGQLTGISQWVKQ